MLRSPFDRWWVRGALATGVEHGRSADLVYASLIPYHTGEAAVSLARELRKPLVVDLQDPWALDEMWMYPTELHRRLDLRRMRSVLQQADAIVMNTPEAVRRVLHHFPELNEKVVVSIPNGFDPDDFSGPAPAARRRNVSHRPYGLPAHRRRAQAPQDAANPPSARRDVRAC